jgi:hypothetical protein
MPDRARLLWDGLHQQLRRAVDAVASRAHFLAIVSGSPEISRFSSATELLSYLAKDLSADIALKGQMYAHLVTCAQKRGPVASFAQTLLWLGLWPGLSTAYARRACFWRDCPEDLLSEVMTIFTTLVTRMNLSRVRYVIANLVRSTERDLIVASVKREKNPARVRDVDPERARTVTDRARQAAAGIDEWLPDTLISILRRRCGGVVAEAVIRGDPPRVLREALGLTPAAARKRLQRGRDRLKALISDHGLSHGRRSSSSGLPEARTGG